MKDLKLVAILVVLVAKGGGLLALFHALSVLAGRLRAGQHRHGGR